MKRIKINKLVLFESIIFSIFLVIGYTFQKNGAIASLFHSFLPLIVFILLTIFFYIFIDRIYTFLDNRKDKKSSSKLFCCIFEYKPFLIPFLIFLISGIWYVICFYPGAVNWDGLQELDYFFEIHQWSTHHPVFPTIIMGLSMKAGRFLIDDNFGIFIYNFIQYIISSAVFAYLIRYLVRKNAPHFLIVVTFLFFLLNPAWLANSYTLIKDTYYYLFFILFVISLFEYYDDNFNFAKLLLSGFMVVLFRLNGIYVVLLSLLFMLIFKQEKNYRVFIISIILLLSSFTVDIITYKAGILKGNIREPLSLPIELTARYLKYGDLNSEEIDFYNSVFYSSVNHIGSIYDPDSVDIVKSYFFLEKENYFKYAKYWLLGLWKSPVIYLDAFLANNYGYVYPYKEVFRNEIAYFDVEENAQVNNHFFNLYLNPKTENIRSVFMNYYTFLTKMPIIRLMFRPGTYTMLFIFTIFYAWRRKKREILLLSVPLFVTLFFCFLSPLNACLRYINPIVVSLPILWGNIFEKKKN